MNLLPYGEAFWRSLNSKAIVYDLIYNPAPTHLLKLSAKKGFFFGFFLIFLFGVRFIVEYVKESQGGIENYLGLLTTGQWLSIPFMLIGLIILLRSNLKKI